MLKISHLTNLRSPNVGNAALTLGSERTLVQDLSQRISFERIAWDDYTFDRKSFQTDFLSEIEGTDALLVAGAVTFNGREDFREAGMRFNLSISQMKRINMPIIFYGCSYRYWSSKPYPNARMLCDALNFLCDDDKNLIAVRNDGTQEWLKNIVGFKHDNLRVIPDPGLFIRYDANRIQDYGVPYICVSMNNEDSASRFQVTEQKEKFVFNFGAILNYILDNFSHDIYLVPHSFEDLSLIESVTRQISPGNLHQRVRVLGLPRFEDAESIYEVYNNSSLVIASRVHSMSPALGMKVPVIVVTTQDRLTFFMREMGLGQLVIDYSDEYLVHNLKELTNLILTSKGKFIEDISNSVDSARMDIQEFNALIFSLLDANKK